MQVDGRAIVTISPIWGKRSAVLGFDLGTTTGWMIRAAGEFFEPGG